MYQYGIKNILNDKIPVGTGKKIYQIFWLIKLQLPGTFIPL
jgi:hypothetical protein